MKIESPLQWGGLAALLAGALLLVSQLLDIALLDSLPFELSGGELAIYGFLGVDGYLGLLLVVLMQLGLLGLYAPQAKAAGIPGMVGLFMALTGIRLAMDPSFVEPILVKSSAWLSGDEPARFWWELAIFGLTFVLGWVLFGIATLGTGAYPRTAAALLVIGALLLLLPLRGSGVVFAVAVAWMGYILFTRKNREATRGPATARVGEPVRWGGGLAALLAGALLLVSQLLDLYLGYLDPGAVLSILPVDPWLGLLLVVLMQLGLAGLYAPLARFTGVLGMFGLFMAFIGMWLSVGGSFISPMAKQSSWPVGEPEEFWGPLAIFALTFVLGWVLFGVAALKTGVYPRVAIVLLIAGALILLLPLPLSNVVFAVAVAWMGYVLFIGRNQGTAQPAGNINLGVHGR